MKTLLQLSLALALSFPVAAQQPSRGYLLPASHSPNEQVLILGEAEARASILAPSKADSQKQYHSFIAKVAAGYEEAMQLAEPESGALIRTLAALPEHSQTKYAVHFAIGRWFRTKGDASRYRKWQGLSSYPEYQYSHLLFDRAD